MRRIQLEAKSLRRRAPRVLVVDDMPEVRRVVRAYLETVCRCEVAEAGNGLEALKALLSAPFDLVMTDLIMPEMTGLELIAFLKRNSKFSLIPVLMLTGLEEVRERQKAVALGVSEYVLKPFDAERLAPILKKYLPAQEGPGAAAG